MPRKPATRLGDMGSNHGAWHPSPVIQGSGDVMINGIPAARKGDALAPHVKPKSPPHPRSISKGSATVFINNQPAVRMGDAIGCGGTLMAGSANVFIGDQGPAVELESEEIPETNTFALRFVLQDALGNPVKGMDYRVVPEGQSIYEDWHLPDDVSGTDGTTAVVSTTEGEKLEYQLVWPKINTDKAVAYVNSKKT
ncbi:type VI secretion system PAAR protein [Sessilibacter corallicola]|uniref:type VI secretion system PAAR protein n=1 Tax=Sessilibacter corallicola TaxID=2904075 RepID=UPI001E36CD50|nr:type VI secretion system PAAR protein [Sessilibacter corallicola]MCE2026838.1 type VI secretion system PAAR protein [Sessilibacter corallicola]